MEIQEVFPDDIGLLYLSEDEDDKGNPDANCLSGDRVSESPKEGKMSASSAKRKRGRHFSHPKKSVAVTLGSPGKDGQVVDLKEEEGEVIEIQEVAEGPANHDEPLKDPLEEDIPAMVEDKPSPKRIKLDLVQNEGHEKIREEVKRHYEAQLEMAHEQTEEIKSKLKILRRKINERDSRLCKTIKELRAGKFTDMEEKVKSLNAKYNGTIQLLRTGLLNHLNYTKSNHPEFLKGSFDENSEDLLLVQLAIKTFNGFEFRKKSLQNSLNFTVEKVKSLTSQLEMSRNSLKVHEQVGQEKEVQLKIAKKRAELSKCCRSDRENIECKTCNHIDQNAKSQLDEAVGRIAQLELEIDRMKVEEQSKIEEATKKLQDECQLLKTGRQEAQKNLGSLNSDAAQLKDRSLKFERICVELRSSLANERIRHEKEMKTKQQIIEAMEKAAAKKDLQFKKRMGWARDQIKEFMAQRKMIEKQRESGYLGVPSTMLSGEETRVKIVEDMAEGLKKLLTANERKLVQKSVENRGLEAKVEKARKDVEHIKKISVKTIMAEIEENDRKWSRSMADKTQEIINLKNKYESGNPAPANNRKVFFPVTTPPQLGSPSTTGQPIRGLMQTSYIVTKQGQRLMVKTPTTVPAMPALAALPSVPAVPVGNVVQPTEKQVQPRAVIVPTVSTIEIVPKNGAVPAAPPQQHGAEVTVPTAPQASRVVYRDGRFLYQVPAAPVASVNEVIRLE